MNRYIFRMFPVFVLLLSACQGDPKEPSKLPLEQLRRDASVLLPTVIPARSRVPKTTAEVFGIAMDDEKITINTREAKIFFRRIGDKMKKSFDKIETTLRKEKIDSLDETGIIITSTKMQIDLNVTKNFMDKWIKSIEFMVNELDETMREIKRELPQK